LSLTCADWLSFVRPWLSEALVGRREFENLREVARRLPGNGLAALEIRLASGMEAADLSLKVATLRGLIDTFSSSQLRQLLRLWSAGGLPSIASIWLEFDLDRAAGGLPDPVVCAEVQRGADPVQVLDSLFQTLDGFQRNQVLRCLGEIPPPARLLYLFDLRARGTEAIRLEILGLAPEAAPAYLARVAPHLAPVVAAVAPLVAGAQRPHLSFDIGPSGIGPRAGLEASFVKWPHREPRWRELFDRLVERGLCAPEKRDAVFAWPGQETFWAAPARWPIQRAGTRGVCVRALSHVKVVARVDRPPEAKVYLLFGWIGAPSPELW